MSNFTACFRLFHRGHSFSKAELALVESLERQRHRTAGIHAVIDDPHGKFEQVLIAYIAYLQHLDPRDAIIVTPTKKYSPLGVGGTYITPRSYLRILANRRPIGQILLLNSHAYCPSLPRHRSRLDAILRLSLPYLNGPNTVVIIHGSAHPVEQAFLPATPFHRWLALAANPQSIYFLHPGPSAEAKPKCLRPHIIHNSQFIIHNSPSPLPSPLLHTQHAPLKIAA